MVKAIIFDWARTLYDRSAGGEFPSAEKVLRYCQGKGYRLGLVSLVDQIEGPGVTLTSRREEIENSPLRKYFEIALVTDGDKDKSFDEAVEYFKLSRQEILIVDDRTIRGIRYGNRFGHSTVWLRKGKFAQELPNPETGEPTHTIHELGELISIL